MTSVFHFKWVLLILFSLNSFLNVESLHVDFLYHDHIEIQENAEPTVAKRQMTQFFDQASFSFNGFQKVESVPVKFPLDICMMRLENDKYAASLHRNKKGEISLEIFKYKNDTYVSLIDIAIPNAIAMDCKSFGSNGYVAITRNIEISVKNTKDASPIYEVSENRIRPVQYFPTANLRNMYLRVSGNDLFLLQSLRNSKTDPHVVCPYFKWSGTTFNKLGGIPCNNARNLEPFSIDYESYVAVANFADRNGRTNIHSEIYKFNRQNQRFELFQKIKTNGAVDVQHFRVPQDAARKKHFLIFGNSLSNRVHEKPGDHLESDSVFYVFEKGQFIPYQSISLYAVEKFLPIENSDPEKFLLLIASSNQDIKIYNLNDWKFEVSNVQYTEGALSKGVSKMRIYEENDINYLVIANENMAHNETNIFSPIFKQEEHANTLRQEIIHWAEETYQRLAAFDIDKLKKDVEEKLLKLKETPLSQNDILPEAHINTVLTKSLIYPASHFNTEYWLALKYAKKALDALEELYPPRQKRNIQPDSFDDKMEYKMKEMKVETFHVREYVKAKSINGINTESPLFEEIKAQKVIVTRNYIEPKQRTNFDEIRTEDFLNVNHLNLKGKLNGLDWDDLLNKTLKKEGLQVIEAPASIENMEAETVVVSKEEISGHPLNQLVSITDGNYVVNQEVQFTTPITVKNLTIHNRLNNIHVHNNHFDVLLKRSNETQIVEGAKNFENLKIKESFSLAGRVFGRDLNSMVPVKAIHEPLILKGNYTIENTIRIGKIINASDIILKAESISIAEVLENGINFNKIVEDVDLEFASPLVANNSIISFINGVNMQELIRKNVDDVQVIKGEKIFDQSLEIRQGFAEVMNLNGINVEKLEKNLLLKDANQNIKVPMHFGIIIAKSLQANNLSLNGKSLEHFLTRSTDQIIKGKLHVKELTAKTVFTKNLNTNGKVFGYELYDIYQQKAKNAPTHNIFRPGHRYNGSVYVQNLFLNSSINNRNVADIERQLVQLQGNIKYVGNYIFNYPMNITNLTFEGSFNGILAENFGNCWLQKFGNQTFTVAQTFAGITSNKGTNLSGKLNGVNIEDFHRETYSLDEPQILENVIFQDPIEIQGLLETKLLNDLKIPDDILLRKSFKPQVVKNVLNIGNNLKVNGLLRNVSLLNNMPLKEMDIFLKGLAGDTLHLQNAEFSTIPNYRTLNQHNIKDCLNEAWLANENVNLNNHLELSQAYFEGLLDFEGPINNIDLQYLRDNYISLTKPQVVDTELIFLNDLKFLNEAISKQVLVHGNLMDTKRNNGMDFNEFVANTLKTAGNHIISGNWSINEGYILGDLQNVQINGLNLGKDVLRNDITLNEISIPKYIKQGTIRKLHVTPRSKINGVDVTKWIQDTVFLYENRTIYGTTSIDRVILFNDLKATKINNRTISVKKLLLRDTEQIVENTITIENFLPLEKQLLTNNLENLNVETINDESITNLFPKILLKNTSLHIRSPIKFVNQVYVKDLREGEKILTYKKLKRSQEKDLFYKQTTQKSFTYDLNDFQIAEIPLVNVSSIEDFTSNEVEDILLTVKYAADDAPSFLKWNWLNGIFEEVKAINTSLEFFQRSFEDFQKFYPFLNEAIQEKKDIVPIQINQQNCLSVFSPNSRTADFYCWSKSSNDTHMNLVLWRQIPTEKLEALITFGNSKAAIIYANDVHIWDVESSTLLQKLHLNESIIKVHHTLHGEKDFFAIVVNSTIETNSPLFSIKIFSSNSKDPEVRETETIFYNSRINIAFSQNSLTGDLFLNVLFNKGKDEQIFEILEFKGAMGFVMLSQIDLRQIEVQKLSRIQKDNLHQDIIALIATNKIYFVYGSVEEF